MCRNGCKNGHREENLPSNTETWLFERYAYHNVLGLWIQGIGKNCLHNKQLWTLYTGKNVFWESNFDSSEVFSSAVPRTTSELVSQGYMMFSKKNIITPWNSNRLPLQSKTEQPRTAWPLWGLLGDRVAFIYLLALGCVRESVIPYLQHFAETPNHRYTTSVCLQTSAINSNKDFTLVTKCFGFCSCSLRAAKLPGWQQVEKAPTACLCECWGEHRLHLSPNGVPMKWGTSQSR